MVLSNVTAVLHRTPAGPRFDAILRGVPNLLAVDDILEVERPPVVHRPLSKLTAGGGRNLQMQIVRVSLSGSPELGKG